MAKLGEQFSFSPPQQVLGFPVHAQALESLAQSLIEGVSRGQKAHVVTLNPEMIMAGLATPPFGQVLKSADLVLPDGSGVVWALKRQKIEVQRVPGIEFSQYLLAYAAQHQLPVALIGASPEVNLAVGPALTSQYPGLSIAFAHHGYFGSEGEKTRVAKLCAETKPWLVLVALGVPAQEDWIETFAPLFAAPCIFVGVGGSFDVWSGTKQRAHPLLCKLGLEWVHRVLKEPFRIKRLYKTLPMFVVKVLCSPAPLPNRKGQ